MDELKKQRKELDELKYLVNGLNIFRPRLPAGVFTVDLYSMMEEIEYLCGYLDCMMNFGIQLLPEE